MTKDGALRSIVDGLVIGVVRGGIVLYELVQRCLRSFYVPLPGRLLIHGRK